MKILLSVLAIAALGISAFYSVSASPVVARAATSSVILAQQQSQAVTIQNFAFSPASLTVAPGTTVTWTNKDSTAHTVTADSGTGPSSSQIAPGQSYSYTFQQSGTYAYHCSIHPQMKATVTVSSTSGQAPSGGTSTTPAPSVGVPAAGPVEAGEGSTAMSNYQVAPLVIGALAVVAAVALLLVRRFRVTHR